MTLDKNQSRFLWLPIRKQYSDILSQLLCTDTAKKISFKFGTSLEQFSKQNTILQHCAKNFFWRNKKLISSTLIIKRVAINETTFPCIANRQSRNNYHYGYIGCGVLHWGIWNCINLFLALSMPILVPRKIFALVKLF